MFPAMQPSRPKYPPPQAPSRPDFQQTRSLSQSTSKPASQIEAMPPHTSPSQPQTPLYNPATCHPVFFSNSFHKPPFSMPLVPSSGFHPSATGYVFNSNKPTPLTKL